MSDLEKDVQQEVDEQHIPSGGLEILLASIQNELKAPKNQHNKFADFYYRNCEDILEAVKPLLNGVILTLSDELLNIGDRFYIKATAKISFRGEQISATAYAREAESKKGMDVAQVTGSASSYARKYALNGLFLIDDSKDPDTRDNRKNPPKTKTTGSSEPREQPDSHPSAATAKQINAIAAMSIGKWPNLSKAEAQIKANSLMKWYSGNKQFTKFMASDLISNFDESVANYDLEMGTDDINL